MLGGGGAVWFALSEKGGQPLRKKTAPKRGGDNELALQKLEVSITFRASLLNYHRGGW